MNAKQEFIKFVEGKSVLCATIDRGNSWNYEVLSSHSLPVDYTEEQYQDFLKQIDFSYDAGYGSQELFGIIWFKDGTWGDRGEYDGSEWWELHEMPAIPESLKSQSADEKGVKNDT